MIIYCYKGDYTLHTLLIYILLYSTQWWFNASAIGPVCELPKGGFRTGQIVNQLFRTLCFAPIVEIDNSCSFSSLTNWSWKSLVFLLFGGRWSFLVCSIFQLNNFCHVKSISPCDNHAMWLSHLLLSMQTNGRAVKLHHRVGFGRLSAVLASYEIVDNLWLVKKSTKSQTTNSLSLFTWLSIIIKQTVSVGV